jgi:signal transduction histidine kinase
MIAEVDSLVYLAFVLGLFSGGFLTWGILQGVPFILRLISRKKHKSKHPSQTKQPEEYKALDDQDPPEHAQDDAITYAVTENTRMVEKERQRIAYELHDDTVQRMSTVRLRMEQFSYRLNKPELLEELNILREELNQVIKSIRLLIWGITLPEFTDKSLTNLLRELVKKLEKIIHLDITFVCNDEPFEFFMAPETKKSVYRMVQEVTQNFVNHSLGFALTIHVKWKEGLMIIMNDNGQGFSKPGSEQVLSSIQKRANDIGASLTITSPIGKGLFIVIELKKPL